MKSLIEKHQLPVNLINARFIKPMDTQMLDELYYQQQDLIIYETDLMTGSLGSLIAHYYSIHHQVMNVDYMGIHDHYTPQGSIAELLQHEQMSLDHLYQLIKEKIDEKGEN